MKNTKCLAVICRYQEDISWVKKINIPYLIYKKGEKIDYFKTINIENIGRESEAFLRFIIENYDDLPEKIVFLQGDPFYHYKASIDFINNCSNQKDLVLLSDFIPICDEIGRPHHFETLPLLEMLKELKINTSEKMFRFAAGAQYLVLKKHIISKSLDWWKNAYNIHKYYKTAPWSFERLWLTIWNYEEKI